jgi:hypothetical protein
MCAVELLSVQLCEIVVVICSYEYKCAVNTITNLNPIYTHSTT